MTRITVDYGIDLGTTNSVVAVLDGTEIKIIQNSDGAVTTPSAIYIDERKELHVGVAAKDMGRCDRPNTALRFKRTMGQGDQAAKLFAKSGRRMRPEELSAEVLKELRRDINGLRGEDVREVVITVPADFDAPMLAATRVAARLAGFRECTIMLEPVAAALAYGFVGKAENEFWLVYDFGGGTFDAAVIHMEDGDPSVVTHAGNNWLGGSDIDDDIVTKKFLPQLCAGRNLPKFDPDGGYWSIPYGVLLDGAEKAKIQVCRTGRPKLQWIEGLRDEAGHAIEFGYELTPEDVEDISRPKIAQTLDLCRRALSEKNIALERIAKVLMVGGSTLNPWVREAVQREFGRPLEFGRNPMTVVAEGAAVFARTIKLAEIPGQGEAGVYNLRISSPLMGEDSKPAIEGRIEPPQGGIASGLVIEFIDEMSGWRTGKILVRDNGSFRSQLRAELDKSTWYRIELFAGDGTKLPCVPNRAEYCCKGPIDVQSSLTHSIGVGEADGRLDVVLKKGSVLPAMVRRKMHRTIRALKRNSGDALRIPFYEGSNEERAVRNRFVIAISIPSDQIARDLPANSEVEITLECDRSFRLKAAVFVPSQDKIFPAEIILDGKAPPPDQIRDDFEHERTRWDTLKKRAEQNTDPGLEKIVGEIQSQEQLSQVSDLLDRTMGGEALANADNTIRAFATKLDELEDALKWPELVNNAKVLINNCRVALDRYEKGAQRGNPGRVEEYRLDVRGLEAELKKAVEGKSSPDLRSRIEQGGYLFHEMTKRDIGRPSQLLQELIQNKSLLTNPQLGETLINEGRKALARDDVDALWAIVRQLLSLLPDDRRGADAPRGAGDTLR